MNSATSFATGSVQLGINDGYAFGPGYVLNPFEFQDLSNISIPEKLWEPINFTQKIESMDDYLQFSKNKYTFEGFRQGSGRLNIRNSFDGDMGVAFIAGFGLHNQRTFLDEGIESLVLSNFSTDMLHKYNNSQFYGFLERYGFHSYDSITSGQYAYCLLNVPAKGYQAAEMVRRELENVTTDIFFSEERYDEFLSILLETYEYHERSFPDCLCEYAGITGKISGCSFGGNYGNLGPELEDLLENTPKDKVIASIKGTIVPYSNSSDFQSEFAKLSIDAASQFNDDARVNFTLREDVARVLMEDLAKNEYVKRSANRFGGDCTSVNDLSDNASTNIDRFQLSNATILQDLSRQILEVGVDNFVGEGSLLYEEYLQLVKECFPPLPLSNSPTTAPPSQSDSPTTASPSQSDSPTTSPPSSASQHLSTRTGIFLSMSAALFLLAIWLSG